MLLWISRIVCALLVLSGAVCGLLGYQKLSQSWPLQQEARRLFNQAYDLKDQHLPYEAIEQQALGFSARARDLRQPGEKLVIAAAVVGGLGLLGLVLPVIAGVTVRTFAPKRTYRSYDDLIAAEAREQLQPDEQLLNTAKVIRGWGRRWDTYCVLLTSRRLILMAVRRSLLANFQLMKYHQEEYDTDLIVGCAIDQHWKGNDIIFEFPQGEVRLRLHFTGSDVSGQRQFWEQVPARFAGRGPSAVDILERRWRQTESS